MRREDGSLRSFDRTGGTSQGDPLSPGNQCMGLQEALAMAQLEFRDQLGSRQLWYMDDGSLVGDFDDIVTFLRVVGSDEFVARTGYHECRRPQPLGATLGDRVGFAWVALREF